MQNVAQAENAKSSSSKVPPPPPLLLRQQQEQQQQQQPSHQLQHESADTSPAKSETETYSDIYNLPTESESSDSEDNSVSEVEPFVIEDCDAVVASETTKYLLGREPSRSVDPVTQARIEQLLHAAGIGQLATKDGKHLADPEVLRRLTTSVSSALDEAAAALTRMRSDTAAAASTGAGCAAAPPPAAHHPPQQQPQQQQQVATQPAVAQTPPAQKQLLLEAVEPASEKVSLVDACTDGDVGTVRKLLTEGRSVHETSEEGESLLSLACSAGYYELAQVLLAMNANVEDRGIKGECTPLMEAASAGHLDIVRLLASRGAEVNAQSTTGNTPLMYACAGGHNDVVKYLLENGANVEDHNENGHTPLMEAASGGHVSLAKILLRHGAGINTHSNEFKESALTLACYKGHLDMVKFLLEAGADQEHKTDEMHTALMEASMDGHVEVARLLLDSGAQVNMPTDSFESPLTLAACGGHVDLAMLLIERGANIEEVNDEGYTPLMEAAREGHEDMVGLLLNQGAHINAQTDETQETALTLACCGGFTEVADFLYRAGADIELGASTPLMEAAQEGHLELVKYLLEKNANVHAQTQTGDTAMTYACENGHTDVADLLLQFGAFLEHESEGGRTPLMKACRAGHHCTVQFLISKGANVCRQTTNNDHTPLSLACAGGHLSVVQLLLTNGADPNHKLKDNSTMLIEAAKGGHTNVVQLLLDYPHSMLDQQQQLQSQQQQQPSATTAAMLPGHVSPLPPSNAHSAAASAAATQHLKYFPSTPPDFAPAILQEVPEAVRIISQQEGDAVVAAAAAADHHHLNQHHLHHHHEQSPQLQLQQQQLQLQQQLAAVAIGASEKERKAGTRMTAANVIIETTLTTSEAQQVRTQPLSMSELEECDMYAATATMEFLAKQGPAIIERNKSILDYVKNRKKQTNAGSVLRSFPLSPTDERSIQKQQILEELQRVDMEFSASLFSTAAAAAAAATAVPQDAVDSNATNTLPTISIIDLDLQQQQQQQQQQPTCSDAACATTTSGGGGGKRSLFSAVHDFNAFYSGVQQADLYPAPTPAVAVPPLQLQPADNGQPRQFYFTPLTMLSHLEENAPPPPPTTTTTTTNNNTSAAVAAVPAPTPTTTASSVIKVHKIEAIVPHAEVSQNTAISDRPKAKPVSKKEGKNVRKVYSFQPLPPPPPAATTPLAFQPPTASSLMAAAAALPYLPSASSSVLDLDALGQQLPVDADAADMFAAPGSPFLQELHAVSRQQTKVPSVSDKLFKMLESDMQCFIGSPDMMDAVTSAGLLQQPAQQTTSSSSSSQVAVAQFPTLVDVADSTLDDCMLASFGNLNLHQRMQDIMRREEEEDEQNHSDAGVPGLDYFAVQNTFDPYEQYLQAVDGGGSSNNGGVARKGTTTSSATTPLPAAARPAMPYCHQVTKFQANISLMQYAPGEPVIVTSATPVDRQTMTPPLRVEANNACASPTCTHLMQTSHYCQVPCTQHVQAAATQTAATPSPQQQQQQQQLGSEVSVKKVFTSFDPNVSGKKKGRLLYRNQQQQQQQQQKQNAQLQQAYQPYQIDPNAAITQYGGGAGAVNGCPAASAAVANTAPGALMTPGLEVDSETESNHDTALTLACAGGHEELVDLLIQHGANIEHRDKKGFTPLILAATAGHEKVVELLLKHNADIEAQSERTKDTPLSLACSGGRYEVVGILLNRNANKEHRNVSDYTPLSLAASGGYVNIIKLLLSHAAEINSRTGSKLGISPLMLAAMNGHTAAVKLLLDMGSDINAQIETNRNTALTLACFQGRHEVVSLLLDRKANVEHRAKTGLTPLMEAASGGYVDVGRVLIDKGADVNATPVPSSRDTALTIAADKGHVRFVELLLNRHAIVEVKNKKGNSPLWLAANGGHLNVVELLHNLNADIDSQDNRKVSCLMAAFRKGHVKVVKWMVNHVTQFPSDQEMIRYMATVVEKESDLLDKCHECIKILRAAKDTQAAKANKNATILLEELDMEKNREESKKAAAARKRERKKKKKLEKKEEKRKLFEENKKNNEYYEDGEKRDEGDDEDKDDDDEEDALEEEETAKDVNGGSGGGRSERQSVAAAAAAATVEKEEGDSGIDANSQGSCSSNDVKSKEKRKDKKKKQKQMAPASSAVAAPPPQPSSVPAPAAAAASVSLAPLGTSTARAASSSSTSLGGKDGGKSKMNDGKSEKKDKAKSKSEARKEKNQAQQQQQQHLERSSMVECPKSPADRDEFEPSGSDMTPPHKKKESTEKHSPNGTSPKQQQPSTKRDEGWKEVVRKSSVQPAAQASDSGVKKISVPLNAISRVIGRGGCNINAIRGATGAHIEVEKQSKGQGERIITIKGSAEASKQAHTLISVLIRDPDADILQMLPKAKAPPANTTSLWDKTQIGSKKMAGKVFTPSNASTNVTQQKPTTTMAQSSARVSLTVASKPRAPSTSSAARGGAPAPPRLAALAEKEKGMQQQQQQTQARPAPSQSTSAACLRSSHAPSAAAKSSTMSHTSFAAKLSDVSTTSSCAPIASSAAASGKLSQRGVATHAAPLSPNSSSQSHHQQQQQQASSHASPKHNLRPVPTSSAPPSMQHVPTSGNDPAATASAPTASKALAFSSSAQTATSAVSLADGDKTSSQPCSPTPVGSAICKQMQDEQHAAAAMTATTAAAATTAAQYSLFTRRPIWRPDGEAQKAVNFAAVTGGSGSNAAASSAASAASATANLPASHPLKFVDHHPPTHTIDAAKAPGYRGGGSLCSPVSSKTSSSSSTTPPNNLAGGSGGSSSVYLPAYDKPTIPPIGCNLAHNRPPSRNQNDYFDRNCSSHHSNALYHFNEPAAVAAGSISYQPFQNTHLSYVEQSRLNPKAPDFLGKSQMYNGYAGNSGTSTSNIYPTPIGKPVAPPNNMWPNNMLMQQPLATYNLSGVANEHLITGMAGMTLQNIARVTDPLFENGADLANSSPAMSPKLLQFAELQCSSEQERKPAPIGIERARKMNPNENSWLHKQQQQQQQHHQQNPTWQAMRMMQGANNVASMESRFPILYEDNSAGFPIADLSRHSSAVMMDSNLSFLQHANQQLPVDLCLDYAPDYKMVAWENRANSMEMQEKQQQQQQQHHHHHSQQMGWPAKWS